MAEKQLECARQSRVLLDSDVTAANSKIAELERHARQFEANEVAHEKELVHLRRLVDDMEQKLNDAELKLKVVSRKNACHVEKEKVVVPAYHELEVIVPEGCLPRQQVRAQAPCGLLWVVTIPEGLGPGQRFRVRVPVAAPRLGSDARARRLAQAARAWRARTGARAQAHQARGRDADRAAGRRRRRAW